MNGTDIFTVVSTDGIEQSNTANISVYITPINDPPLAKDSTIDVIEDISSDHIFQAEDIDSPTLFFNVVKQGKKGQLIITSSSSGSYQYSPNTNENGFDKVIFEVVDSEGESCTGVISIQILPQNDPPVAQLTSISTNEDQSVKGQLKAIDPDNDTLLFTIVELPSKGAITLMDATKGEFIYLPKQNENGLDHLTFKVSDGEIISDIAEMQINILAINDPPHATAQMLETNENEPLTITLTASDIDSEHLTYEIFSMPQQGELTQYGMYCTYAPHKDFWGLDSFVFLAKDIKGLYSKARIDIRVGIPPADIYVGEDQSVDIAEALNLTQTFTIESMPSRGKVELVNDQFIYFPNVNANGFDSLGYRLADNQVLEAIIYIKPINDPPEIEDEMPDHIYLAEDHKQTLNIKVRDVDHDIDDLSCVITIPPEHGQLIVSHMAITYLPFTNYNGSDAFSYQISDGLSDISGNIDISITAVNDAPMIKGRYRLIIVSNGFMPYEYKNEGSPFILLNQDLSIEVSLTENSDFNSNPPKVEVYHTKNSNGFILEIVKHNVTSFVMTLGNQEINEFKGYGTVDMPYRYTWDKTNSTIQKKRNIAQTGDISYDIRFKFYDGIQLIEEYPVEYIEYSSIENEELHKSLVQKTFEKSKEQGGLYSDKAISVTQGKTEFYPLMGTTFNINVEDPNGGLRNIDIVIPTIPIEYLFIDNTDQNIEPDELLKVETSYYTFGENALATGINLKFFLANEDGRYISYNPVEKRSKHAPVISLPIIINSKHYKSSGASPFVPMILESGSDQFKEESLPLINHGDGRIDVQLHHLTAIGLKVAEIEPSEDSSGSCFVGSVTSDGRVMVVFWVIVCFLVVGVVRRYKILGKL
ncbi:outer membrane adhesin-like protein [Candidatus Magnetomorum sp. HK-1]|nr:outer membrane adhesin-like protein [Candidatus Magnetomorum sp. HK-1]